MTEIIITYHTRQHHLINNTTQLIQKTWVQILAIDPE
jgi:hypothetical protein